MFNCIVIGAGPGGLVCTKELLEQGIDNVICLEKGTDLGGTFSNTYDNLVLTSSATMSMFSDFWIGDGNQHASWTKKEAVDYWNRYAQSFGVLERIRFGAEVIEVISEAGGWKVLLASGDELLTERLVLAIGNNAIPNYPDWAKLLTDVEYSHSRDYRNAENFKDKNVLVVGGGESGSDVALETSRVANSCWVSLRSTTGWVTPRKRGLHSADIATHRGVWGLPREYGSTLSKAICRAEYSKNDPVHDAAANLNQKVAAKNGVWGTYGTKTFSLPKAIVNHGCQVVDGIAKVEDGGRTLHTTSGEILRDVDAVVFSTGYRNYVSFLPKELQETDPRSLYKHMFHQKYREKIAWIGWARPCFGSQFPIMEMQARLLALILTGQKAMPADADLNAAIYADRDSCLKQFEHNARRIRSLVDYHLYMDDLADLIGCRPPLWRYFLLRFRIWLRLVYGATQSTQFRLRGPGNKKILAEEILIKLPVSKPTHVVKAGIKGRLIYLFKSLVPTLSSSALKNP